MIGPSFWEVLDTHGNQVLGPRTIDQGTKPSVCGYGFAATFDGVGAVVWSEVANPDRKTGDVRARFFTATGELGPELQVNPRPGTSICPEVAMLPGGREAWVLYRDAESFFPPSTDLHVQRVTFSGQRVGPEITVSAGPDAARESFKIASDRSGNFIVAWSQLAFPPDYCGIAGRLYRADGRPIGEPFAFATVPYLCGMFHQVAFADNGTLAAIWQVSPNGGEGDIYFARFSASPADEPCLVRAGHLLCDTGRTGGLPEIDLAVSTDPAAPLLMGDVDGDGRADPCVVEGNRLRCDLDHRGAPFEWERDFPPLVPDGTDIPLLGDVDGDGKADLCLWRPGALRCRTPSGLFQERFGEAGDVPLLGDVDGDGRADLCVRRGNQFLCDTAHDGGGAELKITFGLPTDLPFLGDFDGDGRADPCLLRGRLLLCDTKHNGGIAEGKLILATQPGDRLLLGNLDGL
ncbi:MAG: FG-GAP repeat domain-containing protein [Thermoanaerobaculia bacterium]